jgi:hypothetical protein
MIFSCIDETTINLHYKTWSMVCLKVLLPVVETYRKRRNGHVERMSEDNGRE